MARNNRTPPKVASNPADFTGQIDSLKTEMRWLVGILVVVLTAVFTFTYTYIAHEAESAAKLSIAPVAERSASAEAHMNELEKRLDRLQAALARDGGVNIASVKKEFDATKTRIREALNNRQVGNPKEVREQLRNIAYTLSKESLPSDVVNEGVSTLVYVAAYDFFSNAYPKAGEQILLQNSKILHTGEAIKIEGGGSIVFDGGRIEDSGQDLSNIYWLHTTFVNARIRYNGGPVYLSDVTFMNCTFEFGSDKASKDLKAALLKNNGKPSSMLIAGNFSSLSLPSQ